MAAVLVIALLIALGRIKHVCATPTPNTYAHPSNGICTDYTVTEEASFNDLIWGLPEFKSNYDVAGFLFNSTRKDANNVLRPFAGTENVTESFTLSGTFCTPVHPSGGKESTVLLATHGIWYDRRYWASSFRPDEYNFAQYALKNGYSIFYYDRLGTGKSQIISGYENSVFGQIELIAQLARKIRAGSYTSDIAAKKVVLVGHSFGSYASHAAISRYPDLVDGAVLTGISYGNISADPFPGAASVGTWLLTAFGARLANTDGRSWARTGYFDFADIYSHTHTFFKQPYDIPTIEFAHSIHQPGAVLEFLSLAAAGLHPQAFKGSVLVATGENDLLACGGNCTVSYYTTGQQDALFSSAKVVETYLHPNAGHGTNFAANATGFFGKIVSFLDRNI